MDEPYKIRLSVINLISRKIDTDEPLSPTLRAWLEATDRMPGDEMNPLLAEAIEYCKWKDNQNKNEGS